MMAAPGFEAPEGVETTTGTVPLPGGAMTLSSSSLTTVTDGEATPPKLTDVVPVKPLPYMVTRSPPAGEPPSG